MRRVSLLVLFSLLGLVPAAQAADLDNRCAYLEAQGDCICAMPEEWTQKGVVGQLSQISGDVMVTVPAGFSNAPAKDGTVALYDPSTIVVPGNGGATLAMGQCVKDLPKNASVYVDKKGDNCECAHVASRGTIPWWPVVAAAGIILIVSNPPGNPASE